MISGDPFTCTWLFTDFPRSDRVVLEANTDHWNRERGPHLEKVVYKNDLDPVEALDKVCNTEGEIDVVSEVSPGDARKVQDSEHANLVTVAALAPPYSGGATDGLEPYPHDPDEARRLLSDAVWPEGRALKLASKSDVTAVAERLAGDIRDSLGIEVEMIEIPDEDLIAAQKTLVEKNVPLPFDMLVHAWFDLAAGYPPAVIHREYFHSLGAFRAGPALPEFEELLAAPS
jgi:peptide/nickel transport system substrate-binding protein